LLSTLLSGLANVFPMFLGPAEPQLRMFRRRRARSCDGLTIRAQCRLEAAITKSASTKVRKMATPSQ
jgi:hypothetical protein